MEKFSKVKIEKLFQSVAMSEPDQPQTPLLLPNARSDKFTIVTNLGNTCATALKKVNQAEPDKVIATIKQVMPELLQTLISVTFEKAKLWSLIESDQNLAHFANLKYDDFFNPGDLNKSELERAQV